MLFGELRTLRKKLADQHQVPPFVIFSDRSLHEMCRYYPSTLPEMRRINGVGDAKLERYGDDFVGVIKAYLEENSVRSIKPEADPFTLPNPPAVHTKKGETVEKSYDLAGRGLSLKEIAKERKLTVSTVAGHLERLMREGRQIDMERLIEPEKGEMIKKLFLTLKEWQLGPIVEHFKGEVSYEEAKLVRADLQCRFPG